MSEAVIGGLYLFCRLHLILLVLVVVVLGCFPGWYRQISRDSPSPLTLPILANAFIPTENDDDDEDEKDWVITR
jgi:hypothetical protein